MSRNKRVSALVLVLVVVVLVAGWTISKRSSSDGWSTVPGGSYTRFQDISCASTKFCGLVGGSGWVGELENGTIRHSSISGLKGRKLDFTSIACPSSRLCFAVDFSASVVEYRQHSWHYLGRLATLSYVYLSSISCSSNSFCMAGSNTGETYVFRHGIWSNAGSPLPAQAGEILSVSCPHDNLCFVGTGLSDPNGADYGGRVYEYRDSTWEASSKPVRGGINALSCGSPTFCLAGTNWDTYLVFRHGSWTGERNITEDQSRVQNNEWVNSISCTSAGRCEAMTTDGYIYEWNGMSWNSGVQPIYGAIVAAQPISCVGNFECFVTDGSVLHRTG